MSVVASIIAPPSSLGAVVPEDSGGPYVAAAYVVFLTIIALYVAIMAQRLARISRQAGELEARLAQPTPPTGSGAGVVQGSTGAGPVQDGAAREGVAVEPRHAHGAGQPTAAAATGTDAPAVSS